MKFLMIHYIDEAVSFPAGAADEEDPTEAKKLDAWVAEMETSGAKQYGGRLRPVLEARTVRVRADEIIELRPFWP